MLCNLIPNEYIDCLLLFIYTYGCYNNDSDTLFGPFKAILKRHLTKQISEPDELNDLDIIMNWTMKQNPNKDTTNHWWVRELDESAQHAFRRIERCQTINKMFRSKFNYSYGISSIYSMNELYISGPNRIGSSDQVFYTEHIDGPFYLFPFASVYRCIVGLNDNTEISTHFTNTQYSKTIQKGDVLAFDFNREPHYIVSDNSMPNKDYRVVLKLHYVIYPRILLPFGMLLCWLTTYYDIIARKLFVYTLTPNTCTTIIIGYLINVITYIVNYINKHIGYNNILYYIMCGYISLRCNNILFLIIATQYIHYFRYITTYYIRKDINYLYFKRDVFLYKCVVLIQFVYLICNRLAYTLYDKYAFIIICIGYGISFSATIALGIDKTYFGVELGYVNSNTNFVRTFPYNIIPHPMIVGQLFGLCGIHYLLIQDYPYLIPCHIAFYVIHMFQEIFNIHRKQKY
jgi:hypothetical protein